MLTNREAMPIITSSQAIKIAIAEEINIRFARRQAINLAERHSFSQQAVDTIANITHEFGTRLIKYASKHKKRVVVLQLYQVDNQKFIELIVVGDVTDISYSPKHSQNQLSNNTLVNYELNNISQSADYFKIYTHSEQESIALAHIYANKPLTLHAPPKSAHQIAGICLPIPTEVVSGDSWAFNQTPSNTKILIADGLGHGVDAASASQLACEVFREYSHLPITEIITRINNALRETRGATVAVAEINDDERIIKFTGIGNIAGYVCNGNNCKQMISHDGTAGTNNNNKIQEYSYPWNENSILIMHSDGLAQRWKLHDYQGISVLHPSIIAASLYRDHYRGNDDVTVVVAKSFQK